MNRQEYEVMFNAEEAHWWYLGMATITRAVLECWFQPGATLQILDAGCGTGAAMTTYLSVYGEVTGIDASNVALSFCTKRQATKISCASITNLPFPSYHFNLITSFDVLYYANDDRIPIAEFYRSLVSGGRLLLRLPAYNWLRGQHDKAVHIQRRYTAKQISKMLREAGFNVELISYANMFLFPFVLIKRISDRIVPSRAEHSDLTLNSQPINKFLTSILAQEAPIITKRGLPFGSSVFAVARKPLE